MTTGRPEFSVWVFWPDDTHEPIERFVGAARAVRAAHRAATASTQLRAAGTTLRLPEKVIITDGGDYTVFEWRPGEGVVFPPRDAAA